MVYFALVKAHYGRQIAAQRATYAAGAVLFTISAVLQLAKMIAKLFIFLLPATVMLEIRWLRPSSCNGLAKDLFLLVQQSRKASHCARAIFVGCKTCSPHLRNIFRSALGVPFKGNYHGPETVRQALISYCRITKRKLGILPWKTLIKEWLWTGDTPCTANL